MAFPIKKRINNELFIEKTWALFTKNGSGNCLAKLRRVNVYGGKI